MSKGLNHTKCTSDVVAEGNGLAYKIKGADVKCLKVVGFTKGPCEGARVKEDKKSRNKESQRVPEIK